MARELYCRRNTHRPVYQTGYQIRENGGREDRHAIRNATPTVTNDHHPAKKGCLTRDSLPFLLNSRRSLFSLLLCRSFFLRLFSLLFLRLCGLCSGSRSRCRCCFGSGNGIVIVESCTALKTESI